MLGEGSTLVRASDVGTAGIGIAGVFAFPAQGQTSWQQERLAVALSVLALCARTSADDIAKAIISTT